MPIMNDRQYRSMLLETPAPEEKRNKFDSECYVEGYAAKFERYVLFNDGNKPVYEEFSRDCFRDCDMSDIIFQFDHCGKVYARQSNGTLTVEADDIGLFICADLSKTSGARSMYEDISTGLVTKMSWGFMPDYDSLEVIESNNSITIYHHKIKKIFDVSAVSIPANNDTEIQARSFVDGEIDKKMKEIQKRMNHIKKIKLLMEVTR